MKKVTIKRVFLVDDDHNYLIIPQDFFGTLSDEAILCAIHQRGKDEWIGNNLYRIIHQNGVIHHWRYEVATITQYEKSWYNYLIDIIRRF